MHGKASLYLILIIIMAVEAMALGIAPGTLESDGGTEKIFVINNEHKDMRVLLYVQGEMAEHVKLSASILDIKKTEETKYFSVTVTKPSKPGSHAVQIIAVEIPDTQEGTVVARQAVAATVNIMIPYPGKFAEAELITPKEEPLNFVVKIRNRGTERIEKADARIEIYSPTNELLASLHTDTKAVEPDELRELVAKYHNPLNKGRYYAKAIVDYDGQEIILEQAFELGNMLVSINNIYVKDFSLGDIARFDIIIESKWNEQIPDVFADMEIKDKYGKQLTKFKTKSIDLSAYALGMLDAYWDTDNVLPGTYNAKISLHFLGNNIEKSITLDVREDAIDIDLIPTARVIDESPGSKSPIIILIVLSIIINASLVLWLARRKK